MIVRCRSCGGKYFDQSLIQYSDMPTIAQNLPDSESVKYDKGENLEVWQCRCCGLVQLNSDPVPYFKQVIRASGFSPEMMRFRHNQFDVFVKRFGLKTKRVVEIGCGKGEYLSIMQQYCNGAAGIEFDNDAVSECNKHGLNVIKGFVEAEHYTIKGGPFDGFFMMNFLEHLPDPTSVLRGIHNNLSVGGVGLLEVPNFDMVLDRKVFSDFSTEHLFYFTQNTLKQILECNGFKVLDLNVVWYDNIISVVVEKRRKTNIDDFTDQKTFLEKKVKVYLQQHGAGNVAVWGAGHQALATIALLNMKDDIRYVVDSAPFKQGKFTPATHLPIVAPETLLKDRVKAVIVMATSYSDEVVGILREQYPEVANIAILRDENFETVRDSNV